MLKQFKSEQPTPTIKITLHRKKQLSIITPMDMRETQEQNFRAHRLFALPNSPKLSSDDSSKKLLGAEIEAKSERTNEQGKSTRNGCTNNLYTFKDYIQKINEKVLLPTQIVKQSRTLLKDVLKESTGESKTKKSAPGLNFAKIENNLSDTSPFVPPLNCFTEDGYKNTPKKRYFIFDDSPLKKARPHQSIHKQVKEALNESDREIFEMFESCRLSIMKHNEWFSDPKAQSKVHSMIVEIEQKWIRPRITSQLKLINNEKEQPEKELKLKQDNNMYTI